MEQTKERAKGKGGGRGLFPPYKVMACRVARKDSTKTQL